MIVNSVVRLGSGPEPHATAFFSTGSETSVRRSAEDVLPRRRKERLIDERRLS
jgi:hypothetical protein